LVRIFAGFEVYMYLRRSQSTKLVLITVGKKNLLRWDVLQQRTCIPNSVKTTLTFVDPCTIVQFVKKNPTRCNNVSRFYYSIFI